MSSAPEIKISIGGDSSRAEAALTATEQAVNQTATAVQGALGKIDKAMAGTGTAAQTTAATVNAATAKMTADFTAAATRVTASQRALAASTDSAMRSTGQFGSKMQQVGYQVGDAATQISMGTSAIQAIGVQAAQLLGAFGPVGAVVGALGITAIAVAQGMGLLETNTDKAEKATKDLADAMETAKAAGETSKETTARLAKERNEQARTTLAAALAEDKLTESTVRGEIAKLEARQAAMRGNRSINPEEAYFSDLSVEHLEGPLAELRATLDRVQKKIAETSTGLDNLLHPVADKPDKPNQAIERMDKQLDALSSRLNGQFVQAMTEAEKASYPFIKAAADLEEKLLSGKLTAEQTARVQDMLAEAMLGAGDAAAEAQTKVDKSGDALLAKVGALHDEAAAIYGGTEAYKEYQKEQKASAEANALEAQLTEAVAKGYDLKGRSIADVVSEYRSMNAEVHTATTEMKRYENVVKEVGESLSRGFESAHDIPDEILNSADFAEFLNAEGLL